MSSLQMSVDGMPQNGQNGQETGLGRFFGWRPWGRGTSTLEFEQAYHRFLDSVKDVLSDFTTLEVNTVLVRNISADHPLTDAEFLRQIAEDLYEWFTGNSPNGSGQRALDPGSLRHLEYLSKNIAMPLSQPDRARIDVLRMDSTQCLGTPTANARPPTAPSADSPQPNETEHAQPAEYRRFLRYLQKLLMLCESDKWDGGGMLRGREQQQLRKLWELVGTSFIYAQTVVGLDGDVISRINEQLFRSTSGLSRDMIEALMRFHSQNAESSVQGRNSLMAMIVNTFQAVLRR
jgi:hypothetical protein